MCQNKKHIFEWFLSWMYFFINDYGRSLFKPVIGLLVVYISFALLFNFTDSFFIENSYLRNRMHNTQSEIFSSDSLPEVMHDLDWLSNLRFESRHKQVLVFSSVNMLGPLRLLGDFTSFKYKRTRYLFLSWLQAILSTILWYTFIVGIKRRFKTN